MEFSSIFSLSISLFLLELQATWNSNSMAAVSLDSIRHSIKISKHLLKINELRWWKQISKIGIGPQCQFTNLNHVWIQLWKFKPFYIVVQFTYWPFNPYSQWYYSNICDSAIITEMHFGQDIKHTNAKHKYFSSSAKMLVSVFVKGVPVFTGSVMLSILRYLLLSRTMIKKYVFTKWK